MDVRRLLGDALARLIVQSTPWHDAEAALEQCLAEVLAGNSLTTSPSDPWYKSPTDSDFVSAKLSLAASGLCLADLRYGRFSP